MHAHAGLCPSIQPCSPATYTPYAVGTNAVVGTDAACFTIELPSELSVLGTYRC